MWPLSLTLIREQDSGKKNCVKGITCCYDNPVFDANIVYSNFDFLNIFLHYLITKILKQELIVSLKVTLIDILCNVINATRVL